MESFITLFTIAITIEIRMEFIRMYTDCNIRAANRRA